MAQKILLKRGVVANIADAVLDRAEPALAYSQDGKVQLWIGTGENGGKGKVLINPDLIIPSNLSEFTNDEGFQTAEEVTEAIKTAIAGTGHATFEKVNTVPSTDGAEDNILYLVMNADTNHYDIYAKVGNEVVLLDDTTVDLSGYITTEGLESVLADYVKADGDKVLSDNNYTDAEKEKLAGLSNYVHPSNHAADMIIQDDTHRFVSDAEKESWNSKLGGSSIIDGGTF